MIKVGSRTVFQTVTLFIPNNESATIELRPDNDDDIMLIEIKFEDDESSDETKDKKSASFNIHGDGNRGIFTFKNWNSVFGSSITKPIYFGTTDKGERVSFLGNAVKLGESHKIELQFMKGGESNEQ